MTFRQIGATGRALGGAGARWVLGAAARGARGLLDKAFDVDTLPDVASLPTGTLVELPGRGETYVVDVPGPTPDAPVLLLMHAIATTGQLTWFAVVEELAKSYRVINFDQRWHGGGIASEEFSLEDCADDGAALLDYLGVDQAIVVGYSMGGASAQLLWHRHPDKVAGLVLCSTSACWRQGVADGMFYAVLGALAGTALADAHHRVRAHGGPEEAASDITSWCLDELRRTSLWGLPKVFSTLGRFDATTWITGVNVPTAVVITTKDKAISPRRQAELAALIPEAAVFEAPGGHTALMAERTGWQPVLLDAIVDVAQRAGDLWVTPPGAVSR